MLANSDGSLVEVPWRRNQGAGYSPAPGRRQPCINACPDRLSPASRGRLPGLRGAGIVAAMPDLILLGLAAYLLGAAAGLALVAASPLPAALFWGIGMILHLGLAAAELCGRLGIPVFSGMEGDLRHLAFTLGPLSFALGAIFSLIIDRKSTRLNSSH